MCSLKDILDEQVSAYFNENNIFAEEARFRNLAYEKLLGDEQNFSGVIKGCRVLEFGIGSHLNILSILKYATEVDILEGSPIAINKFKEKHPDLADRVNIIETSFEDYLIEKKYDRILMEYVLEHVDDPLFLLKKYKNALCENGKIIITIPNAESLHRIIGHKMGMLDDVEMLSDVDLSWGHKRYYHMRSLKELLEKADYTIVEAKGLFLKPLTTTQLKNLELGSAFYNALIEVGYDYPEISNAILIVAEVTKS
jgi:SAM-dependent methyltransferase